MELLGDDPIEYFNIMVQLPNFNGATVVPSEYGYIVSFREIIRQEIPRMKYFVNYKGIVYNLSKKRFLIGGLDSSGYRQVTLMGYDYCTHLEKSEERLELLEKKWKIRK